VGGKSPKKKEGVMSVWNFGWEGLVLRKFWGGWGGPVDMWRLLELGFPHPVHLNGPVLLVLVVFCAVLGFLC